MEMLNWEEASLIDVPSLAIKIRKRQIFCFELRRPSIMSRFLVGDELGNIKSLRHQENKAEIKTIHDGSSTGKSKGIQALSIASTSSGSKLVRIYTKTLFQDIQSRVQGKLAAGHTDGSASTFILKDDDQLELLHSWKETRFRPDQTFVGLSASEG